MNFKYLFIITLFLYGCGQDNTRRVIYVQGERGPVGERGETGERGSDGVGKDGKDGSNAVATVTTYTFASNTNCQLVATGISAKKPSASSNNLNIYATTNCTGSTSTVLQGNGGNNEGYMSDDKTLFFLEGSNALGLKLRKIVFF